MRRQHADLLPIDASLGWTFLSSAAFCFRPKTSFFQQSYTFFFVCTIQFMEDIDKEISGMKIAINARARVVANEYMRQF
jgi:hypothetical protein